VVEKENAQKFGKHRFPWSNTPYTWISQQILQIKPTANVHKYR